MSIRKNKSLYEYALELAIAAYLHPQDKAEKQIKAMIRRFKKEVSASREDATKAFKVILHHSDPVRVVKKVWDEIAK